MPPSQQEARALLSTACALGRAEAVTALLAEGVSVVSLHRSYGSALHVAVRAALASGGGGGGGGGPPHPSHVGNARPPSDGEGTVGGLYRVSSLGSTETNGPGTTSPGALTSSSRGSAAAAAAAINGATPAVAAHEGFEAAIAVLLGAGADPFVEDPHGQHCLDVLSSAQPLLLRRLVRGPWAAGGSAAGSGGGGDAAASSSAAAAACIPPSQLRPRIVRQLEAKAPFSVMLRLQLAPFSSRDFGLMWLVVLPRRFSQPYGSPPKAKSRELWVFPSQDDWRPLFRAQLDGCDVQRDGGDMARLLLLPSDQPGFGFNKTFMRRGEDAQQEERWVLRARPLDTDAQSAEALHRFLEAISSSGGVADSGGLISALNTAGGTSGGETGLQQYGGQNAIASTAGSAQPVSGSAAAASASGAQPGSSLTLGSRPRNTESSSGSGGSGGGYFAQSSSPQYPGGEPMVLPIALALAGQWRTGRGQGHAATLLKQVAEAAAQLGLRVPGPRASAVPTVLRPVAFAPEVLGESGTPGECAREAEAEVSVAREQAQGEGAAAASLRHGVAAAAAKHAAAAADVVEAGSSRSGSDADVCNGSAKPTMQPTREERREAAPQAGADPSAASVAGCCVVCLSSAACLGFRHGRSVHRCVCAGCAVAVIRGACVLPGGGPTAASAVMAGGEVKCPLCRQPVEEVLAVF